MALISFTALRLSGIGTKTEGKELRDVALFGPVGNVLTLLLYSAATIYISVGLTCLLNFCYPLIVVAISYVLYREKVGKYKLIASVLMIAGLVFISGGGSLNLPGLLLGLGSALSFAVYILAMEHSCMASVHGLMISMVSGTIGFILLLTAAVVTGGFSLPGSGKIWILLFFAALTSNVAPMVCLSEGMKKDVSASKVGFLCIIEPACALIWDLMIFHTRLTLPSIIGVAVIFASFFITLRSDE